MRIGKVDDDVGFEIGKALRRCARLHYQLTYETDSISDFNSAVNNPKSAKSTLVMSPLAHNFQTYLGGELMITILDQTDEGVLVVYNLIVRFARIEEIRF